MADWSFKGFTSSGAAIPVPDKFFSEVLPRITDINELKTALYVFWMIKHRRGYPRFITVKDLLQEPVFIENLAGDNKPKNDIIVEAINAAAGHGILLTARLSVNGIDEEAVFLNMDPDRAAYNKLVNGELKIAATQPDEEKVTEPGNIYSLYEQNIGLITPIVAEELKRAEKEYPEEWIRDAFKNAVEMNKRNWRYISRILEIWSTEGKDNGKTRGYSKKDKDAGKYVRGRYGHMVNR